MKINFQRTTLSTQFIPEIDGMRFFAILTVVIFHLNTAFSRETGLGSDLGMAALGGRQYFTQLGWWISRMDLGVKVFFAISGFVLALPFLKQYLFNNEKKVNLSQYFIRRLTRLEPPFVLSLILFLLTHIVMLGETWQTMGNHFWAGLIYAHVFIYGEPNPINPVTWSLETEAQFYVMVPLLFAGLFSIKNSYGKIIFGLLLFAGSVFMRSYFLKNNLSHLADSLLAYLSNFITGIFFAYLYVTDKNNWFRTKILFWDAIGFLAIFSIFYFYKPQASMINNVMFNLVILLFMISIFKGRWLNTFFSFRIIYIIGGMCYSIYLLHFAFFHLLVKFTGELSTGLGYRYDLALQMLLAIPALLVVSGIFFILVEKPCMDKNWPIKLMRYFNSAK